MKKVFLFLFLSVIGTFVYANNSTVIVEKSSDNFILNGDCGGCIAWADSRDDGSDRTNRRWQKDLDDCRASSSACNE